MLYISSAFKLFRLQRSQDLLRGGGGGLVNDLPAAGFLRRTCLGYRKTTDSYKINIAFTNILVIKLSFYVIMYHDTGFWFMISIFIYVSRLDITYVIRVVHKLHS